mmetsp:Transcript_5708/g.8279  ORF Transcript_5708/g.8279 Transcript_5708/m.8279 type:complete len:290 (+) Transcript_5708:890-1759(+)
MSFASNCSLFRSSETLSATFATNLGPLSKATVNASVMPNGESLSLSIGRLSLMNLFKDNNRCFSSICIVSQSSTAFLSTSPKPLVIDASLGRTSLPSLSSRSLTLCLSERIISPTYRSNSPSGPGTSIGRTASPPLLLDWSILAFSDSITLCSAKTALASAFPRGLLSFISFGLTVPLLTLSTSESLMSARSCTALRSKSERGPPSSLSFGRTNSPSDSAIRFARLPSSSITSISHCTADFSAFPRGPRLVSSASIGRAYAGSSPIIRAIHSSSIRSASFFLNNAERHL